MLNIFVNTWGNYNMNGADGGEWITLPMDSDELQEVLKNIAAKMGDNDPEWAIHDYEWTTEIELAEVSEYASIEGINDLLNELGELSEYDQEEIAAAVEAYGYSIQEAVSRQSRGCFTLYRGMTLEEVAEEIVNECYVTKDTPNFLLSYFDYAAFAQDLVFDGYHETTWGVIYDC